MNTALSKINQGVWKRLALVLSMVAVMFAAQIYLFWQIQIKNQAIAETTSSIESLIKQQNNLKQTQDDVTRTEADRAELDSYFIAKDGVVSFLNSIQSLGAENNLKTDIESVNIEPSKVSPDNFENVNLVISAYGSWSDLYHFGQLVELLPYSVNINSLDYQKFKEAPSKTGDKKIPASASWKSVLNLSVVKIK